MKDRIDTRMRQLSIPAVSAQAYWLFIPESFRHNTLNYKEFHNSK